MAGRIAGRAAVSAPGVVLSLGLGVLWWWAVVRLAVTPGAGALEGTVAAGGWGLSLLPVHCVAKARAVGVVAQGRWRAAWRGGWAAAGEGEGVGAAAGAGRGARCGGRGKGGVSGGGVSGAEPGGRAEEGARCEVE
ncbi:hypothetical protein AB0H27_26945 [Streptomyces rishiriensis]